MGVLRAGRKWEAIHRGSFVTHICSALLDLLVQATWLASLANLRILLASGLNALAILPPVPQVASLTRLRTLHLRNACYECHQQAPLAALNSTLQSLCIDCCDNLPDCLPQMLALGTLVSMDTGTCWPGMPLVLGFRGREWDPTRVWDAIA